MSRSVVYCRWHDGEKWRIKHSKVAHVVGRPHWDVVVKMAKTIQTFYNERHVADDNVAGTQSIGEDIEKGGRRRATMICPGRFTVIACSQELVVRKQ